MSLSLGQWLKLTSSDISESDETLLFIEIDNYTALGFNSIIKEQLEKVTKKQSND